VTIGEESLPLPDPFFVLATQNPIEHEGTYPLPEAQIDRFIFKLVVQYPSKTEELLILDRVGSINTNLDIESVFDSERLHFMRQAVDDIYVDSRIKNYIVDLVRATRFPSEYNLPIEGLIQYGASPRATLSLYRASKGQAFLAGRNYVTPDDVKQIALDVMRHRVILHYEAEADDLTADLIVQQILDGVPVP
jgi:MoxR-like ATPase